MVETMMRNEDLTPECAQSEGGVILSSPSETRAKASIDLTHLPSMWPSPAGGVCSGQPLIVNLSHYWI